MIKSTMESINLKDRWCRKFPIKIRFVLAVLWLVLAALPGIAQNGMVVYQTDFGLKDGAVSEMKGEIREIDETVNRKRSAVR